MPCQENESITPGLNKIKIKQIVVEETETKATVEEANWGEVVSLTRTEGLRLVEEAISLRCPNKE